VCLTLALGHLLSGLPATPFLAALFCFQTSLFGSDRFMRDDAEPGRQSLLPALFFSLFGLEINIIRIFELLVPFAAKLAEMCPIVLFAVAHVLDHFKVRLGTEVLHLNLKRPQKITAQPGALFQLLENLDGLLEVLVKQKQIFVNT
jgi:hypothetical protein